MKSAAEIREALPNFYGTQEWHIWSVLYRNFLLTDGAKYLADSADAYWLMDLIASYQPRLQAIGETFQTWTLTVFANNSAKVTCDDGNGHTLVTQKMDYTTFPLEEIKLFAIGTMQELVILLPSEY